MSVRRDYHPVRRGLRGDVGSCGIDDDALVGVLPDGLKSQRVTVRPAGFLPASLDARLLYFKSIRRARFDAEVRHAFGFVRGVSLTPGGGVPATRQGSAG